MQCDDASRDGSELCEGLGPLPEADLIADPHNLGGFGTDYYAAGTVRRLLAAERERIAQHFDARDMGKDGKPRGIGFYDPHEPAEIIRALGPNAEVTGLGRNRSNDER